MRQSSDRGRPFRAGCGPGFVRMVPGDGIAYAISITAAASIFAITSLILYELFVNSNPARAKFGWNFLFTQTWDPVAGQFGSLPFIYGTVITSALSLLIAVPLGIGAAIFLAELAPPRISNILTFMIELLRGSAQRHLRATWDIHPGAIASGIRRARAQSCIGVHPTVPGDFLRGQLPVGRDRAFNNDRAVHRLGVP